MKNCGGCTECCTAFPVIELKKLAWKYCKYCKNGCTIYTERPKSCRLCKCSYIEIENAPIELRPDKCGVIFERANINTIVGTIVRQRSSAIKKQVKLFEQDGFRVILQTRNE